MPKASFSVRPSLWEAFSLQASALFLNRGPFLAHVLSRELPHLHEDLQGLSLSRKARRYVAGMVGREVPLQPNVNIEVTAETVQLMRALVDEHNLVRDAFFCRLLVLLRGSDKLLKHLDIPRYATDYGTNVMLEEMPSSPLKAMEAVRDDPLYYMREHVKQVHGEGLYRVLLPFPSLHCYVDDEHVEGTGAYKERARLMASL